MRNRLLLVLAIWMVVSSLGGSAAIAQPRGCSPDWGDAPASYGDAGLCVPAATIYLGDCVDEEVNPLYSAGADGDDTNVGVATHGACAVAGDDEDGVTFDTPIDPGQMADVTVINGGSTAGVLNAWVDFNADGDFADAGEQIFTEMSLALGSNSLSFAVPGGATQGPTYARFNLCDDIAACNTPTSFFSFGEVEDYLVTIVPVELQSFTIE